MKSHNSDLTPVIIQVVNRIKTEFMKDTDIEAFILAQKAQATKYKDNRFLFYVNSGPGGNNLATRFYYYYYYLLFLVTSTHLKDFSFQ